jgi:hypothetical protein
MSDTKIAQLRLLAWIVFYAVVITISLGPIFIDWRESVRERREMQTEVIASAVMKAPADRGLIDMLEHSHTLAEDGFVGVRLSERLVLVCGPDRGSPVQIHEFVKPGARWVWPFPALEGRHVPLVVQDACEKIRRRTR